MADAFSLARGARRSPCSLAEIHVTDLARWSSPASYESFWNDRARVAAGLLGSATWLCDLGCGQQALRHFLPANVRYLPADLVAWNPEVAVCELNANKWHSLYLHCCDIVYVLGVLEYLNKPNEVLGRLARTCSEQVISYNPSDLSDFDREGFGWMNSYTRPDLHQLLQDRGYDIVSSTVFERTQMIVKARSTVESSGNAWRRLLARRLLAARNWCRR